MRWELGDDGVAVEGHVGDQATEGQSVDQRRHPDCVIAVAGQKDEAHKVTQRVGQRQDLGGHATLGAAYGLALSPPFEPCP